MITEFLDNDDSKYYMSDSVGYTAKAPASRRTSVVQMHHTNLKTNIKKIELKHLTQQIRIRKKTKKLKLKTCKMGKYYKLKSKAEKKKRQTTR